MGRFEYAAKDLNEALTQIEKVSSAEPNDVNVKVELANAESRIGQMLLDSRDAAGATRHFAHAAGILSKLVDADPGNAIFRRGQSVVENQWAAALRVAGQVSESVAHNEKALSLAQALSHDAPGSVQYRSDAGICERKLSESLLAAHEASAALHHAEQGEQILCQIQPTPSDAFTLANCGRSLLAAGNAHLALNNPDMAILDYRKAEKVASQQSQADPLNAVFRSDWARAQAALANDLFKLGDDREARSMYERALQNWSALRQANSLTGEDAHRFDEANQALAKLRSR